MADRTNEVVSVDAETLTALRGSIAKWERVVADGTDGTRWKDCPLCVIFWDTSCRGCPVMRATGMDTCRGSPFSAYDRAREEYFATVDGENVGRDPAVMAAAQAELDFLKSLLPPECGDRTEGNAMTVWERGSDDYHCVHCGLTWDAHLADGDSTCPRRGQVSQRAQASLTSNERCNCAKCEGVLPLPCRYAQASHQQLARQYTKKFGGDSVVADLQTVRFGKWLDERSAAETAADQKATNPPGCVCRFAHPSDPMCTYVPMWSCPRCKVGNGEALLSCQSCATPRSACACTWYDTGGVHAEGCRRAVKTSTEPGT